MKRIAMIIAIALIAMMAFSVVAAAEDNAYIAITSSVENRETVNEGEEITLTVHLFGIEGEVEVSWYMNGSYVGSGMSYTFTASETTVNADFSCTVTTL